MFKRKPASISLNKIKVHSETRYAIIKNSLFDSKVELYFTKNKKVTNFDNIKNEDATYI